MNIFEEKILKKIEKIKNKKDVPVVCCIYNVKNKKEFYIFSNNREKKYYIQGHAEIRCINKIFKRNKSKNLSSYSIITSMSPCEICYAALKQTNINEIMYYLSNEKNDIINTNNKKIKLTKINSEIFEEKYKKILKSFFKKMR